MEKLQSVLQNLRKKGIELTILRSLPSGKEARVYLASIASSSQANVRLPDKKLFALKVYQDHAVRSFQKNQIYLAGKYIRKWSERKSIRKRTKFGKNLIQRLWVKREFYLLSKLYHAHADIPQPYEMDHNAILMAYIGNRNMSAPLLKDVSVSAKEAEQIFHCIMKNIDIFYHCGIVHSDLSEFNILYWEGKIYIIDFPQAVDTRNNPHTAELLERDKMNIEKWYHRNKERTT